MFSMSCKLKVFIYLFIIFFMLFISDFWWSYFSLFFMIFLIFYNSFTVTNNTLLFFLSMSFRAWRSPFNRLRNEPDSPFSYRIIPSTDIYIQPWTLAVAPECTKRTVDYRCLCFLRSLVESSIFSISSHAFDLRPPAAFVLNRIFHFFTRWQGST